MLSHSYLFRCCVLPIFVVACLADDARPNVLFLMTDQHRFDAIRRTQDLIKEYDGKTKIKTPNLDKLSTEGAYFLNAYTQSPVCGPARTVIRTGCVLERTGVQTNNLVDNEEVLSAAAASSPAFTDKLSKLESLDQILVEDYGYTSEYYGKWHLPLHLYQSRNQTKRVVRFNDYDYQTEEHQFAYNTWGSKLRKFLSFAESQGELTPTYLDLQQEDTYSRQPYTPITLDSRYGMNTRTDLSDSSKFDKWSQSQNSILGRYALPPNLTSSFYNHDVALKALERLASEDTPWLLTVSYHHPHPTMMALDKYLDYYWDNRHDLFVSPNHLDPMNNTAYNEKNELTRLEREGYLVPENIQEWTAVYYAMVEEVDVFVGEMLSQLENMDLASSTIVIFTSDHGEMLGSHRGFRGKARFFEEATKIPLMIKYPNHIRKGTVVNETVSHLDLMSTILDYVGAAAFDNSDGKSLRRFIESNYTNSEYDETVVVAEWDYRDPQDDGTLSRVLGQRPSFAIWHQGWKLIIHKKASSPNPDMLHQLSSDPYEESNHVGVLGNQATDVVIGKAELLRVLLLEWMLRMDGGAENQYYSHPLHNAMEGEGDVMEILNRQQWRASNFWISHRNSALKVGRPVWNGTHFVRNEYFYFGRRTQGTTFVDFVRVLGVDSSLISLDISVVNIGLSGLGGHELGSDRHIDVSKKSVGSSDIKIDQYEHVRVRVQYASAIVNSGALHARIILRTADDESFYVDVQFEFLFISPSELRRCNPTSPCGRCEATCSSDDDCQEGLVCGSWFDAVCVFTSPNSDNRCLKGDQDGTTVLQRPEVVIPTIPEWPPIEPSIRDIFHVTQQPQMTMPTKEQPSLEPTIRNTKSFGVDLLSRKPASIHPGPPTLGEPESGHQSGTPAPAEHSLAGRSTSGSTFLPIFSMLIVCALFAFALT